MIAGSRDNILKSQRDHRTRGQINHQCTLRRVEEEINQRPRKTLKYKSPPEREAKLAAWTTQIPSVRNHSLELWICHSYYFIRHIFKKFCPLRRYFSRACRSSLPGTAPSIRASAPFSCSFGSASLGHRLEGKAEAQDAAANAWREPETKRLCN